MLVELVCSGESLPEELVSLSDVLSQALGIGPMYADAAIINFYSRKSTLAPHVDRLFSEETNQIIQFRSE